MKKPAISASICDISKTKTGHLRINRGTEFDFLQSLIEAVFNLMTFGRQPIEVHQLQDNHAMKEKINVFDYSKTILESLRKGVLLTTKVGDKTNTMTISWGALGIEWAKPMMTVYVREHRFTHEQLEANPEFTISIPMGEFDRKILGIAGTKSGRDVDKIKELGVTLESPEVTSVPGIKELPLTLECRVVYKQKQDPQSIKPEYNEFFYPQDIDSTHHDRNKDYHTAYYGEIVDAYIIK